MQHRMLEINIVPALQESPREIVNAPPSCVSSIQTGSGGYKVKRVLHHHTCYYKPKSYGYESKAQQNRAVMLRAVFITCLALTLVFLLLWFVSSLRAGEREQFD